MSKPYATAESNVYLSKQVKINLILTLALGGIFLLLNAVDLFYELVTTLLWVSALFYVLIQPVNLLQNIFRKLLPTTVRKKIKQWQWCNLNLLKTAGRVTSIIIVMGLFFTMVAVLVGASVRIINHRFDDLSHDIPVAVERLSERLSKLANEDLSSSQNTVAEWLQKAQELSKGISTESGMPGSALTGVLASGNNPTTLSEELVKFFRRNAGITVQYISSIGSQSINTAIFGLTGLVLLFYFLLEGDYIARGFIKILPKGFKNCGTHLIKTTHLLSVQHVNIQTGISLVITLMALSLNFIFQIKYPIISALFLGFCSLLPVLGIWVGTIPTTIVLYATHHELGLLLLITGLISFYITKRYVLFKRIPSLIKLHPLMLIFSLFIGLSIFGLSALLFVIPTAAFLTAIVQWLSKENNQPAAMSK